MITNLPFSEQSAFFARLSNLAYKPPTEASKVFKKIGYTSTYYEKNGSNVYVLEDDHDIIIVCRGTEVKEWADINADLTINLVPSRSGVGKVHRGFRNYTDNIWEQIKRHVTNTKKTLWLTGHSLGAAVATLMARRFVLEETLPSPHSLFTFGSPRVGNRTYINEFNKLLTHHRWVNEGDIVTKVPFSPWYYHCGTKHHVTKNGVVETKKITNLILYGLKLILNFPKQIINSVTSDVKDHSSDLYTQRLLYWSINLTND